jgi:hypothetical protein
MLECFVAEAGQPTISIIPVRRGTFDAWMAAQSTERRRWILSTGFKIGGDAPCLLPQADGGLQG